MCRWLSCFLEYKGHGAKKVMSELLTITPSGLSKILERESGFDAKTYALTCLIQTPHDEKYEHYPVEKQTVVGGILFQRRRAPDGPIDTWRAIKPTPPIESLDDAIDSIEN
jgi:hypothetical protein